MLFAIETYTLTSGSFVCICNKRMRYKIIKFTKKSKGRITLWGSEKDGVAT